MKALWHINKEESRLLIAADTFVSDTSIVALYSLISTGTERLVANGLVPPELFSSMQVPYMEGNFDLPVKYGYSLVGKVLKSNSLATGTIVHIMHPHQDCCNINATDAFVIPANVPAKRSILAANIETAINAVWDAKLQKNSTVLIAGYGIIGALLARVCKQQYACTVYVLEQDNNKKKQIGEHGYLLPTADIFFDVAFNCSASETALQYCIDHVKAEAAVVELSWYGTKKISICLGGSFHSMRKKIIASQVSKIPLHLQPEWDYYKRKTFAFELLQDDFYDQLLTNEIVFEQSMIFFNQHRHTHLPGIGYYISY